MAIKKTLGGDRLGSGKKMQVAMRNFERSTHDLSRIWRSTMAPGTLVPFFKEIALPGDTWDIRLNANVMTLPTLGPLFGSFKMQMDIFQVPIRLYNARLHMNELGIGMNMKNVKFPTLRLSTRSLQRYNGRTSLENWQINQSSLLAYLGIRGNGYNSSAENRIEAVWNATPLLAYWDIYKNYYANKQEEIGAYLTGYTSSSTIQGVTINGVSKTPINDFTPYKLGSKDNIKILVPTEFDKDDIQLVFLDGGNIDIKYVSSNIYTKVMTGFKEFTLVGINSIYVDKEIKGVVAKEENSNKLIKVKTFPLKNIDNMREKILKHLSNTALELQYRDTTGQDELPYYDCCAYVTANSKAETSLNGLALKTYQSDIFNNWLSKEWIDGTNGINAITAIDTSSGSFTIDTLNLSKKVYDMLNRVAVSGGSYEDWLQAVYSHNVYRRAESPIYLGGLSKEVIFQEVVSNSGAEPNSEMYLQGGQPLGTLAGRGKLNDKHKGGYVVVKVDEPSYIIGIVSLTPRIDYSQGIDWDVKLRTLDDLHKPSLDQIGFQDLVTDQMAFWEKHANTSYSAGKQPAWINYMTSYNKTYGGFADPNDQMFMTLNRRYEMDENYRIKDLTTYIDPMKFNYIFADTRRDAQNFWVQIASDVTARRKMSAKVMPNL